MKSLEEIGLQLNKLRIGKLEDIAYDSIDPINEITDIFKKDCKIFDSGISDGINFNRMVMDKNFLGRPLEVLQLHTKVEI